MEKPIAGKHFPKNRAEFNAWFSTDEDCLDYLEWLRWPDGFACERCEAVGDAWSVGDGRYMCSECGHRASVTSGTIFHRTRTPLTVWFITAWIMTAAKNGLSALALKREAAFGSYQTAWAMLHKYRSCMDQQGRARLSGRVEVDETFVGAAEPGKPGRSRSKASLVGIAVEVSATGVMGRVRMRVLPDAKGKTLLPFVQEVVQPGSEVVTDAWAGYRGVEDLGYTHTAQSQRQARILAKQRGEEAPDLLPGAHRIASLFKRWIMGTHQGAFDGSHLQSYLDEYVFRFNRRTAKSRGLLFYRLLQAAVVSKPLPYRNMIKNPRPGTRNPSPPGGYRKPRSLAAPRVARPWRADPANSG